MKQRISFFNSSLLSLLLGLGPILHAYIAQLLILVLAFGSTMSVAASRNDIEKSKRSVYYPLVARKVPGPNKTKATLAVRVQGASLLPGQSSTLLPDGRSLLIGGESANGPRDEASISDVRTGEPVPLMNKLHHARAWHSATMLPDGRVLILGGVGKNGSIVRSAEVFDPDTQSFALLPVPEIAAQAYHTATLLTDGRVLITGGSSDQGGAFSKALLWDFKTKTFRVLPARLSAPRQKHKATLLYDGNLLIEGGIDDNGNQAPAELFNTEAGNFNFSTISSEQMDQALPFLEGSLPANGASDVPVDTYVALRFSKRLRVETLNPETLILTGPEGTISTKVVPAESGRLAFITPKTPLLPGLSYTISVAGAIDESGRTISPAAVGFTIKKALEPQAPSGDSEDWIPNKGNLSGDWRSNRPDSPWQKLASLQASPGVTALAGQILLLNGNPLADVTLGIGTSTTRSDRSGRFLLESVSGHHVLVVDGRSANKPNKAYGVFKIGVDISASRTNALPFTIWMPKLDTASTVTLKVPTTSEVVITTPHIPQLELHLPTGTVIRGTEDQIVTQVSITPIPIDRPPYPLPAGLKVPVFFTIQPGGATVIPPRAQVYYPNYTGAKPGSRTDFWRYEPEERGWYIYGQGTVTMDGRQVVPDPGVVIYEFGGIMSSTSDTNKPNSQFPPPGGFPGSGGGGDPDDSGGGGGGPGYPGNGSGSGGDPVDLSSGLFLFSDSDLALPDTIPITLTRTYRPGDSYSRGFGIGTRFLYDMQLWSANNYQEVDLVLPSGAPIHYVRISPGTGWTNAVYEHSSTPTSFYKSQIAWNGNGWDLKFKDGTVYVMGEFAPLQAIRDRYGNQLTITRTNGQTGNITQITSPNGRWVKFTYDNSNRITQARDNIGRTVNYTYDSGGRLWKVTDPSGGVTEYTYDIANQMLTVKDPKGITSLTNEYDANGRVRKQILADNTPGNPEDNPAYQFAYVTDSDGKVTQTDVTDPRGNINRVTFNSNGYPLVHTYAAGRPEQQSITYERQSGSNIILSMTDHLGRQTTFTRQAMGYVTDVTVLAGSPEAVTAHFTYEPVFNLPATLTDSLNRTTTFTYDSKGSVAAVNGPLNRNYTFTNSPTGQRLSATDPMNNTWQFTYDGPDLSGVTDPLNRAVSRFTDAAGRTVSTRDPLGQLVRYEYDALNRLTRVTDPRDGVTSFTYDQNSNLLSLTDARNGLTSFTYDSSNRRVSRRDPLLRDEVYQHNLDGTLQQVTDRKGQVMDLSYDVLGRLTGVTYGDGSSTTYTLDSANRVTQIVDSVSGSIGFTYDNFDRLTSKTTPQGTISYSYNALGQRTSMTVTGQPAVTYGYDGASRLTQITQGGATVTIGYDSADRRTSLTLPNGVVTEYLYDAASQLIGLTYKKNSVVLGTLTYAYDAVGQRIRMGGTFARTGISPAVSSAAYNAANQQTGFAGQSLTFDENGNLINDGANTYAWDARNQLVSMSGPGVTVSFQYDALGNRITKTVNGVTTSYLYDGANLVQEQSGGTATSNALNGGVDEVFLRNDATGAWSPITDGVSSTLALTDSTGAVQTEYTYSPFGSTTVTGATNSNPFQYTGRENDGTGLYYYRARYYSPSFQRFISEDPIGLAGGPNVYAYVGNNPISLRDPFGLGPDADPLGGLRRAIRQMLDGVVLAVELMALIAMSRTPGGGQPNRIYSARALVRSAAEPGPYHNFPESFNRLIFQGNRTVISDSYVLYTRPGSINGVEGVFEIGVRPSATGGIEVITHRFFRPN